MFVQIVIMLVGFVLLVKGADVLVDGASNIAKKFHIPEIIIGLTIVSIGTSLPELFVSITSAIDGYPDMAIGNVVGSNIANMLLILGMSAIIKSIAFKKETRLIEIPICLAVSIIFMILCNLGQDITRIDAGILLTLFVVFIIYTIVMAFKGNELEKTKEETEKIDDKTNESTIIILFVLTGCSCDYDDVIQLVD